MFWKAYSEDEYAHRENWYTVGGKRVFDLLLALLLIPVLLPILLAISVVIAATGGSPFFGHKRIGKDWTCFAKVPAN